MKAVLVLGVFLTASSMSRAKDTNRTEVVSVDVDDVLSNSRMYQNYFKCLTNKGRCTSDGILLKGLLKDSLPNVCAKCSDIQKNILQKVFRYMDDKKANDLDVIEKIYDPERNYRRQQMKLSKENQ